jgi:ABC-2 type transport system permease protein
MLTAVKNQIKVNLFSVKYNLMREMTNHVTFLMNVSFMVLNNATFIIQWILLFHLRKDIGGYSLEDIMLLWGLSASTYGLSHIFFQQAYSLPWLIMNGKLDSYLVQPKNVLLGIITSATNSSAVGDLIYGYLVLVLFKFSLRNLLLFTLFSILGALIMTAFAVIAGSISFYLVRGDILAENMNNILIHFCTYPDTIFKESVRLILYVVVPTGFVVYLPMKIMIHYQPLYLFAVLGFAAVIISLAFLLFYRGLRRYTSSNLMMARI